VRVTLCNCANILDNERQNQCCRIIRRVDTGAPFEAHNEHITGLALSFDCALLASADYYTIKLWGFESRQLLVSFDVLHPGESYPLILSPNAHQVAYTTFGSSSRKIYICDIPPDILTSIGPARKVQPSVCIHPNRCTLPALIFSCRPDHLKLHASMNSTYVVKFFHSSTSLIHRRCCDATSHSRAVRVTQ